MLPSDVEGAARDLYNAVSDNFFSSSQIYNWIWQAAHILAKKAWLIEVSATSATVASTQAYAYPTNAIALKRISVNGRKLKRITGREDDAVTLSNQASATMGSPIYYTDFAGSVNLRPIPDAIYTMVTQYYSDQPIITAATTPILLPTLFHMDLVDYVLWRMYGKDKDNESAAFYREEWKEHVADALKYTQRKKRTDSFATVQSEDTLPVTILGEA